MKSKLSPQDLDDVLRMLKTNDTSLNSFSLYNRLNSLNQAQTNTNINADSSHKLSDKINLDSSNLDADSTIIADNSALNTSTI